MNLFGIGNLELIAILVVALMILGPGKMVETARTLGKFWAEAQRTLRSVADAATVRLDEAALAGQAGARSGRGARRRRRSSKQRS